VKQHVRDAGVAGSNPATPTIFQRLIFSNRNLRNELRNEIAKSRKNPCKNSTGLGKQTFRAGRAQRWLRRATRRDGP